MQSNIDIIYQTLLQVGITHGATHLRTSADTALRGSERFIQSNEVSVFKSVYFTLQPSCCTTRRKGCSQSLTKPQLCQIGAFLSRSCNFSLVTYSRDQLLCRSDHLCRRKRILCQQHQTSWSGEQKAVSAANTTGTGRNRENAAEPAGPGSSLQPLLCIHLPGSIQCDSDTSQHIASNLIWS